MDYGIELNPSLEQYIIEYLKEAKEKVNEKK